jgi:hypothetical protein
MTTMRVRYREHQPLRTADLNDEQAYRLAMRRRHHIGGHDWGIVTGLALVTGPAGFGVQPGMAIDGYGRELIVPDPVSVPWVRESGQLGASWPALASSEATGQTLFDRVGSIPEAEGWQSIAVWLLYQRIAATPPQRGRWESGPDRHSRWIEEPVLRLRPGNHSDPRKPPEVPSADWDFSPHQDAPDDQGHEWPVFLGQLRSRLQDGSNTRIYDVDLAHRPYVTLVGETVTSPTGKARMQLAQPDHGRQRFSVSFPDGSGILPGERLTTDNTGETTLRGNVRLTGHSNQAGNLLVAPVASSFSAEDILDPAGLAAALGMTTDRLSRHIAGLLPTFAQRRIANRLETFRSPERITTYLAATLNRIIKSGPLYDPQLFRHVPLRPETRTALARGASGENLALLNRILLEAVYSDFIRTPQRSTPEAWGIELRPLPEPPIAAAPWQIYHTIVPPVSPPGSPPTSIQAGAPVHQLRWEIVDPGDKGDPRRSRLAIGRWHGPTFAPCLAVQADGTVIIRGRLIAERQVVEGPIQADIRDPRFAAALLRQTTQGLVATTDLQITVIIGENPISIDPISTRPTLSYTIKIANTGRGMIKGVQVYENIMLNGASQRQGPLGLPFDLNPPPSHPQEMTIDGTYTLPPDAAGKIDIAVIALGVGPANLVMQASANGQVTIP